MARTFGCPGVENAMDRVTYDAGVLAASPPKDEFDAALPSLDVRSLRVTVAGAPSSFPEWPRTDRVRNARCHVFQCADILEIWLDTIGRARRAQAVFVGVYDETKRPVMFLPLGIERRGGVRVLGFLDGTVSDYCLPVLYPAVASIDAAAAPILWQQIRSALPRFDIANFEKMPKEVGGLPNPLMHLGAIPMPESGHVMSLEGSREMVERRIPTAKRHLRYVRSLTKERTVSLEVAETPGSAKNLLEDMVRNKTRKFEETRVPGFEVPGKLDFFREATARLPNLAPVHISAIRADDTVIASHWGLVFGDRFYFLMTAYADGIWRKYSPGRILNDELIRWCHANGYRWFDFGIGDEAYKFEYCDVTLPLFAALIPVNLAGRLYIRRGAALAWLRGLPLWRKLRPYKWVVLRALRGGPPTGEAPTPGSD